MATDLIVVPPASHASGVYTFPDPTGLQVSVPSGLTAAQFIINMDTATKTSVGLTLSWQFLFSSDGGTTFVFRNGGTWSSYGPSGYTDPKSGQLNPDPVLTVPLADHIGHDIRGVLTLNQMITAGVTVSVT